MVSLERSQSNFDTTRWTLLDALHANDEQARQTARQELSQQYWPSVYAMLRRRGRSRDEAAELTQAFFAQVVFGRLLFEQSDASKGRLRALLLTALRRFEIDQHRHDSARQSSLHISSDLLEQEERFLSEADSEPPGTVYDRRWAVTALDEAMKRCARYCQRHGLQQHWRAFEMQVVRPAVSGCAAPSLEEVARQAGFDSPSKVASATKVVRKRLRILLREVVAETVTSSDQQQVEYEHLVSLLR